MAKNWSLSQFYTWVDSLFGNNITREINEADFRDGLKVTAEYADDIRVAATALNASLIARSLNNTAIIYVRGDVGDDTRTGELDSVTGATGAVKTLARVIQLHSGKTQKLSLRIISGTVEVANLLSIDIPELTIMVYAGATLRFRKRTGVLDSSNVVVGEGTWPLQCFTNTLTLRIEGTLDVEAHAGSTGAGNQFYYPNAQGAIAICTERNAVKGIAFQTIMLTQYGTITVGDNTTLCTYGTNGNNGYGSELARYKRLVLGGTLTLGTGATESALKTDKLRETLVFEGNGSAKTFNIRRSYAFEFAIVYNDGCTITAQPAGNCSANADNTLTFTGAVGKTLTVRLTSNLTL